LRWVKSSDLKVFKLGKVEMSESIQIGKSRDDLKVFNFGNDTIKEWLWVDICCWRRTKSMKINKDKERKWI